MGRLPMPSGDELSSDLVAEMLQTLLGVEFNMWRLHGTPGSLQFDSVRNATPAPRMGEENALQLLKEAFQPEQPVVRPLAEGCSLVIFPLSLREGRYAASGLVETSDVPLLERLAQAAQCVISQHSELHEQHSQVDAYAEQVSYDFEELTWLRGLAEQLEYCNATNKLGTVASGVLPSLRNLINVDSLLLISSGTRTLPDQTTKSPVDDADEILLWCGERIVSDEVCLQLVRHLKDKAQISPAVDNRLRDSAEFAHLAELTSCVLVPVAKSDCSFGWLLAINKRVPDQVNLEFVTGESPLGLDEFGTFDAGLMAAAAVMLATHARNVEQFQEKELLLIGIIRSLVNTMDAKDAYTCGHSERVALIARRIARQLELDESECEQIYVSGLLHDIGKIGVPDEVLQKPGKLTEEEFDLIRQHPVIGYQILKHLQQFAYVLPGVLHHHESVDGSGYPHGLKGTQIPLMARILAVADSYDAMTSSRPYRTAMPVSKAESILRQGAGTQWDAAVIDAFTRVLDDVIAICDGRETASLPIELLAPAAGDQNSSSLGKAVAATPG